MRYEPQLIERIKERLLLSDIMSARVKLKRAGKEFIGLCPFHGEKTPSFTVNDQKGFYHCFGCGAHGNIFDYWIHFDKLTFPQAVEEGARIAGISLPKPSAQFIRESGKQNDALTFLDDVASWYESQLWAPGGEKARLYLQSRGISEQTARHFRLGFAPRNDATFLDVFALTDRHKGQLKEVGLIKDLDTRKETRCRFQGRLIFPILSTKGKVVGFGGRALSSQQMPKYLNSPETPYFKKGENLYNFSSLLKVRKIENPLLIVEGYMDVISLYEKGYKEAVAPLGTAITETQIQLAWKLESEPLLMMDGDQAGIRAEKRAMERIVPLLKPNYSFGFLRLPQGEDPDSLIQDQGKEQFKNRLQHAVPLIDNIWQHLYDPSLLKTPEKIAYLDELIKKVTGDIQDRSVQYHYRKMLQDRFFQIQKGAFTHKSSGRGLRVSKPLDSIGLYYKILLAILYKCPSLLEEVIEELVHLDLPTSLLPIKESYVSYFYEDNPLEKKAFHAYLEQQGLGKLLRQLADDDLIPHAPYLKEGSEDNALREGWSQVQRALQLKGLTQERLKVGQNLRRNFTQKEWERYQALWKEEQDKPQ